MIVTQHLAVDLGASSGRVALVSVSPERVSIDVTERFPNGPVRVDGWRWNLQTLTERTMAGVAAVCAAGGRPLSVGVDTWGVDYGWIDDVGQVIDDPFCYRDSRSISFVDELDADRAYHLTGIPNQAINTSSQLLADIASGRGGGKDRLLFMPDLINFALTGEVRTEATIASTSQLIDVETGEWSPEMTSVVGIKPECLPEVRPTGTVGPATNDVARQIGARLSVESIASHDTASALAATPILEPGSAYLSLGTWACIGVERKSPMVAPEALHHGFTNERGLAGGITFHRSAMGLWLLQQCVEHWGSPSVADLVAAAAELPTGALIDPDDPLLFEPGDMPTRIGVLCARAGEPKPTTKGAIARCIVDSLAASYARDLTHVERITGEPVQRLHIVGGGSLSPFICQSIADASNRLVIAGPAEATTLGNALAQARAYGGPTTIPEIRELVARSVELRVYEPGNRSSRQHMIRRGES